MNQVHQVLDQEQLVVAVADPFTGSSFSSLFQFHFVDNDFFSLKKKSTPPHYTFSQALHLKGLNYLALQSHCNWWVWEGDRDHDSMSRNKVEFGKDEQNGSHCV